MKITLGRELLTAGLMLWLILAMGEPLFVAQRWDEFAKLAGVAGRSMGYAGVRLAYALCLLWNLIPAGGGGGK